MNNLQLLVSCKDYTDWIMFSDKLKEDNLWNERLEEFNEKIKEDYRYQVFVGCFNYFGYFGHMNNAINCSYYTEGKRKYEILYFRVGISSCNFLKKKIIAATSSNKCSFSHEWIYFGTIKVFENKYYDVIFSKRFYNFSKKEKSWPKEILRKNKIKLIEDILEII